MALTEFLTALDHTNEVELQTLGRVTGEPNSRPVWFVKHEQMLYLMPVTGAKSNWYRNVLQTPKIHLVAGGTEVDATVKPITDPERVAGVVEDFRDKYGPGDVASYYPRPEVAVEVPLR